MSEINGSLLVRGELLDLKPESLVTDPLIGTLVKPRIWFNSTAKALKLFDGTEITSLGAGGDFVDTTELNNAIDNALAGLDFQADVIGLETSYVDTPGRYIYIDGTQITGGLPASAGDIVDVDNTGAVTAIAYDVSVAGPGALVWNRAGVLWMRWNGTDWAEFGGLTGFTAGNGINKTGDVVSVKPANSSIIVDINGVSVGDLSATYTTPAALATAIDGVNDSVDTKLIPYAQSMDVTAEIATAVTGLASTASVTAAIDNALAGLDFQADILGVEADFAGVPGRYIITDGLSGLTAVASNANDIITVDAAGLEQSLDYDVSVAGPGALVWNRADSMWLRWNGTNWAEFGGLSGITAGDGIDKTGDVVSVKLDGASLTKGINGLKVGDLSATYKTVTSFDTDIAAVTTSVSDLETRVESSFFPFSTASATSHTITHNLGYQWPVVQVVDAATNKTFTPDSIEFTSVNELVITVLEAVAIKGSVTWVKA